MATVAWLERAMAMAQEQASQGPIAIFGTAIAAMAFYGALKEHVMFFVDEDPNRIGRHYDGRLVFAPDQAPKNIPVFLALPGRQAQLVAERCRNAAGLYCICPPEDRTQLNH